MKFLFIITLFLLLQSCQHPDAVDNETTRSPNQNKLFEAASYNTQLGLGYLKQGDRPRAKNKLFLALSQAPNSPEVNAALGYFMEKSGDLDAAQKYYHKALSVAPQSGAQLNNYGTFLCRQGKYREAETYFLKAVGDLKYANTAGAYENAGLCVMAIPDRAAAKNYFVKALEHDPSREQSLLELVSIEEKQNHLNEALLYLQKFPNASMNNPSLLKLAIDVAHKAGKRELEAEYKLRLLQSEKPGE